MNFLNGSFRVGSLFGINIRVHMLFLLYIAFRLIQAQSYFTVQAAFLAMLFGIVLLHEFGHCLGARSVGGDARDILMWPLGGLAYAHAPMRPWPQFVTIACGPLVNLIFVVISGMYVLTQTGAWELLLLNPFGGLYFPNESINFLVAAWIFYQVNLMLLAFNLLPIYPLDGGQIFQAIIWPFVGLQRATYIACHVGLAGSIGLGVWSLAGGGNTLLFIAIFGGYTCYQRLQMLRYGAIIDDDRFRTYGDTARYSRRRSFWSRLWRRGSSKGPSTPLEHPCRPPSPNPNPGGWAARQSERAAQDEELDRILKKVSDRGIASLTYVERQTLERVTRQRQQEERELNRHS
ncbi:MAG: site-2 protease family protein [Phycisphaerae bacterium]|jgi:Zn-dependent protease